MVQAFAHSADRRLVQLTLGVSEVITGTAQRRAVCLSPASQRLSAGSARSARLTAGKPLRLKER